MRQGTPGFEREDVLVCADVLGGFGVSSAHVRERAADATGDGAIADLEAAIQRALADPEHPTAFVRRTIAAAPRGVDSPARFWTTAPETQVGDVFAAIDWTFDVRSANGRSLSVDDAEPYRLRVEDADDRTRSTTFSFPETPLGDDNYPALVHAINEELLYGLDCRFVQLSDGTDRWRFALVKTDEHARLADRFGERVTAFDRPLLAADQPAAYAPDSDVQPTTDDATGDGAGGADGDVPLPSWARESRETSWRGRRLTADAFDADHVGGLDRVADDASDAEGGIDSGDASDPTTGRDGGTATTADAAAAIEFVEEDGSDSGDSSDSSDGEASADDPTAASRGRTVVRDAESTLPEVAPTASDTVPTGPEVASGVSSAASPVSEAESGAHEPTSDSGDEAGNAGSASGDDLDGWSIGGSVDATTRSPGSASVDGTTPGSPDAAESSASDATDGLSTGRFTWGDDGSDADERDDAPTLDDTVGSDADLATTDVAETDAPGTDDAPGDEDGDDGFFSADAAASFDAGAKTSRVEGDSFGVDASEQTEDDQFAAVGAALAAPAEISCRGLLDDDEFLPHLPRSGPDETRLTFEDEFDPTADPAAERETDDGFVWVNESRALDDDRTSASD